MEAIIHHLREQQSRLSRHPFLSMLLDPSIDIHQRMSFVPAAAPFVMNMADIFRHILRDEGSTDRIQRIINKHTLVDDSHWQMYLRDVDTMFGSSKRGLTEAVRLLWADHRSKARINTYRIISLASQSDSVTRLVVLQSIEATGGVAFPIFTEASREYTAATGKELVYFGQVHEKLETGHLMGTDDIETTLLTIVLTPEMEQHARVLVDAVFAGFSAMLDEFLAYTRSYLATEEGFHA